MASSSDRGLTTYVYICTTFGWDSALEMAVSMMAIFSRFALPLMAAGRNIVLTATRLPFQCAEV
jgi:hypothetical protein